MSAVLPMIPPVPPVPDPKPLQELGERTVANARAAAVAVVDDATFQLAAAELVRVRNGKKDLIDAFEPAASAANAAHKAITGLRGKLAAYFDEAEAELVPAIGRWQTEQDRIRRQKQAQIEADLKRREEDARLEEAQALSDAGDLRSAEALIAAPIDVPVVELPRSTAPGLGQRRGYGFEIVDKALIPEDYKTINDTAIRRIVNTMGMSAAKMIPGIRVFETSTPTVRR